MSLTIERLRSRFHAPAPLPAGQCEAWLEALTEADGEALCAGLTRPDEWLLIRRLPLALRWRDDASGAEVTRQWSQALRHALEEALAHPASPEVVRYASRREALADLLYRSALGETARQWAWQRMDLMPRHDSSPDEILSHGVSVLLREPELIWPVLHGLILGESATASLTATLRGLPRSAWQALLRASPRSAGYAQALAEASGRGADAASPESDAPTGAPGVPPDALAADLAAGTNEAVRQLLAWIAARNHFAARYSDVLDVLVAALAWPATATSSAALLASRLSTVHTSLRTRLPGVSGARPSQAEALPPARRAEDLPPLPALPQQFEWSPTRWAGALFWLGRLSAGPLLSWQAGQDLVSLPTLLRALGEALGVSAEDPALRALCGGEVPPGEIPDPARQRATQQVARWAAWLDEAAAELPEPRLETVCRRSGRLRFEAGWIELHLPLDGVDTSIRRLGLDLDPGWLPWLGCVLRIVYDE